MTPAGGWRSVSVPVFSLYRPSPFHASASFSRDTPSGSLQRILPPSRRQHIQAPERNLYSCSAIHFRHSGPALLSGGWYSAENDKKIGVFFGLAFCHQLDGAGALALCPTPYESAWQVRRDWKWQIPEKGGDPDRWTVLSLLTLPIRWSAGSGSTKGLLLPCSDSLSGTAGQGTHYPRTAGVREFGFLCTKKVDKHLKLRVHPNNMGPSDISNLVRVVAAKQINDGALWSAIKRRVHFLKPVLSPKAIALIANGFARMHKRDLELFLGLAEQAAQRVEQFEGRDSAIFLNALARLEITYPRLMELFADHLIRNDSKIVYDEQHLALIVNAYGKLSECETACALFGILARRIERQALEFTPQGLANVVNGFYRVAYRDDPMMTALVPEVLKNAQQFEAQHVANLLQGYAWHQAALGGVAMRTGSLHNQVLTCLAKQIVSLLEHHFCPRIRQRLGPVEAAACASALATSSIEDRTAVKVISDIIAEWRTSCRPDQFALILYSLSKLKHLSAEFFPQMTPAVLTRLPEFNEQSLVMLLHAYSRVSEFYVYVRKAHVTDGTLLSALSSRLNPQIVNELPTHAAVMTLYALASVGLRSPLTEALLTRLADAGHPQRLAKGAKSSELLRSPNISDGNPSPSPRASSVDGEAPVSACTRASLYPVTVVATSDTTRWSAEGRNLGASCLSSFSSGDSSSSDIFLPDRSSSTLHSSCALPASPASSSPCSSLPAVAGTSSLLSSFSLVRSLACDNQSTQERVPVSSPSASPPLGSQARIPCTSRGHDHSRERSERAQPLLPANYAGSIMMSLLKLGASDRVDIIHLVCDTVSTARPQSLTPQQLANIAYCLAHFAQASHFWKGLSGVSSAESPGEGRGPSHQEIQDNEVLVQSIIASLEVIVSHALLDMDKFTPQLLSSLCLSLAFHERGFLELRPATRKWFSAVFRRLSVALESCSPYVATAFLGAAATTCSSIPLETLRPLIVKVGHSLRSLNVLAFLQVLSGVTAMLSSAFVEGLRETQNDSSIFWPSAGKPGAPVSRMRLTVQQDLLTGLLSACQEELLCRIASADVAILFSSAQILASVHPLVYLPYAKFKGIEDGIRDAVSAKSVFSSQLKKTGSGESTVSSAQVSLRKEPGLHTDPACREADSRQFTAEGALNCSDTTPSRSRDGRSKSCPFFVDSLRLFQPFDLFTDETISFVKANAAPIPLPCQSPEVLLGHWREQLLPSAVALDAAQFVSASADGSRVEEPKHLPRDNHDGSETVLVGGRVASGQPRDEATRTVSMCDSVSASSVDLGTEETKFARASAFEAQPGLRATVRATEFLLEEQRRCLIEVPQELPHSELRHAGGTHQTAARGVGPDSYLDDSRAGHTFVTPYEVVARLLRYSETKQRLSQTRADERVEASAAASSLTPIAVPGRSTEAAVEFLALVVASLASAIRRHVFLFDPLLLAAATRAAGEAGFQDPHFYATSIARISAVISHHRSQAQSNEGVHSDGAPGSPEDLSTIPIEAFADLLDGLAAASYKMTGEECGLLDFLRDKLDHIASSHHLLPRLLSSLRRVDALDEPVLLFVLHRQLSLILSRLRRVRAYSTVHTPHPLFSFGDPVPSAACSSLVSTGERGSFCSAGSDQTTPQQEQEQSGSRGQVSSLSLRAARPSEGCAPASIVLHPLVATLFSVFSTPPAAKRLADGVLQLSTGVRSDIRVSSQLAMQGKGGERTGEADFISGEKLSSKGLGINGSVPTFDSLSEMLESSPTDFSLFATSTYMSSINFLSALMIWLSRARLHGEVEFTHHLNLGPLPAEYVPPVGRSAAGECCVAEGFSADNTTSFSLLAGVSSHLSLCHSPVAERNSGTGKDEMTVFPGSSHHVSAGGRQMRGTLHSSPVARLLVPSFSCFRDMLHCFACLSRRVLSPLHLHAAAACAEFLTPPLPSTSPAHLSPVCAGLRALGKLLWTSAHRGHRSRLDREAVVASPFQSGSTEALSSQASRPEGSCAGDGRDSARDLLHLVQITLGTPRVFNVTGYELVSRKGAEELSWKLGSEKDCERPTRRTARLECSSPARSIPDQKQGHCRLPYQFHHRLLEILCNYDLGRVLTQRAAFYSGPGSGGWEEVPCSPFAFAQSGNLQGSLLSFSEVGKSGGEGSAADNARDSPETVGARHSQLQQGRDQLDDIECKRLHREGLLAVLSAGDRLLGCLDDLIYSGQRGGKLLLADAISVAFWCCMRLVTKDSFSALETYATHTMDTLLEQTTGSNGDLTSRLATSEQTSGRPHKGKADERVPRAGSSPADSLGSTDVRPRCLDNQSLERTLGRSLLAATLCAAPGRGKARMELTGAERERILLMIHGEDRSLLLLVQSCLRLEAPSFYAALPSGVQQFLGVLSIASATAR